MKDWDRPSAAAKLPLGELGSIHGTEDLTAP